MHYPRLCRGAAFACLVAFHSTSFAQWTHANLQFPSTNDALPALPYLKSGATFRLDGKTIANLLANAPMEGAAFTVPLTLHLPMPDGSTQRFAVVESPILSPELAAQIPIKTYTIQGLDDVHACGRIDYGTYGFHGMILSPHGDVIIDPMRRGNVREYISYFRRDSAMPREFTCYTEPDMGLLPPDGPGIQTTGPTLKTYRLALNTTTEYTTFYGGVTPAQAGATTSVNRVTGVYERDAAVRLNMTYLKCWTGTDPYSNNNGSAMLSQNQTETDASVGNANYDIGHVFSTGGGGIASLGVVGITGQKARGVTGLPSPIGDVFDIDYVAHEMGHQYSGRHSFNGTTGSCGGGRDSTSAYEPGSGSTIMAYAGICGSENLQNNSDAYFHTRSIDQIVNLRNSASSGGTTTNTGNNAPIVSAGPNITIPQSTPFRLTATASDPDNDPLTYCWEQYNLGTASPTTDNSTRPLFRSFLPSTSPTRFFPRLVDVLNNASPLWEILPNVNRSMTFRCTVRDNRAGGGGVETSSMVVTVSGAAMVVTSPNTNVQWFGGSQQTVTWTVGGGAAASPNVNILLSTSGGTNYGGAGMIVLKANTPNDGSEVVTLPAISTTTARIFVEGASSPFYDVSNVNFRISLAPITGTVTLGDFGGNVTSRPVTFELRQVGSTTPIQTVVTNLGPGGTYSFNAAIPAVGTYDITAKGTNWLRARRSSVNITATGATGQNFTLINGDVNGDNSNDIGDFAVMSGAFGKSLGEPGFVLGADLNGDDSVDIGDFAILSSKFGLDGID